MNTVQLFDVITIQPFGFYARKIHKCHYFFFHLSFGHKWKSPQIYHRINSIRINLLFMFIGSLSLFTLHPFYVGFALSSIQFHWFRLATRIGILFSLMWFFFSFWIIWYVIWSIVIGFCVNVNHCLWFGACGHAEKAFHTFSASVFFLFFSLLRPLNNAKRLCPLIRIIEFHKMPRFHHIFLLTVEYGT